MKTKTKKLFHSVKSRPNWNQLNEKILKFWKENKIFEKSLDNRSDKNKYVFYDGPPFVTGLPHYGSLLPSIAKDLIPRYQTMKGKKVRRVWGWDCHGLPIENKVEEKLNIKNRRDIEKTGLKKFINHCQSYVSQTSEEWNWYIDHIGRWVDLKNAYKTMDIDFMESVIWVFKKIYDKGLIYKGKRISLFCPHDGTPVSNFEIAMDNSYKTVTEKSTTYKFKLTSDSIKKLISKIKSSSLSNEGEKSSQRPDKRVNNLSIFFLAWSTTPWNKIVTTALALNPNLNYILVRQDKDYFILAEKRQEILQGNYDIIAKFKGKNLLNLSFVPLYKISEVPQGKKAFITIPGDFVTCDEGSGIVTMAVYGEDDFKAMKENNIWRWEHVDDEGIIRLNHPLFKNIYYLKANKIVDEDLAKRGLIYRWDNLTHSVPLCWRCGTRLIYKPQSAWFIKISQLKNQLKKTNQKINWFPKHLKFGRFQKGIETAPDWCISRSRYWATPIPIWECDKCQERKVLGSIAEIEKLSGKKVTDLHRPFIDEFTFPCQKCSGTMKRIPEVLDCWMESGSMPYGERHYPFENKKDFEQNFPADFICEYIAQTRAWFYVLHVLSNALFNSNGFKNVITTGVIKGTDGRKMSKSYGNYPDPKKVIETYGADALRLYLMSSVVMSGENLNINETEIKEQNQRILSILWNSYKYFVTYANLYNFKSQKSPLQSPNILDQWILVRTQQFVNLSTYYLDRYNIPKAARLIRDFVSDISTWYIRESRDRFASGDESALNTLFYVLKTLCLSAAPAIPFITEEIFKNLSDIANTSVHLQNYPKTQKLTKNQNQILEDMKLVRVIAAKANSLRKEKQIPTRQPLALLTVKSEKPKLNPDYLEILKTELNVKKIIWKKDKDLSLNFDFKLTPDLIDEGQARKIIRKIQQLRKKAGTKRDEFITVSLPDWPRQFEQEIKRKALVAKIQKSKKIEIIQ